MQGQFVCYHYVALQPYSFIAYSNNMATWVNHEWFQHICSCEGDIASSGDSNGFNIDVNVLIYPSWISSFNLTAAKKNSAEVDGTISV